MATAALRRAMNAFTRPPDPTDAALLRQFADGRSETAFAALVRRHGPLVLGVCRRMVPDRHLAEDAFQAAFVVLARRAGGIDPTRPLGPWLYGVAHRVALRARTMIGRRRKRETLAAGVPEVPHTPPVVDDTTAILDEEIARLPDTTREAVILCELQGLSRREAAKRLGIAEGTLSSRLAAARKVLAAKLRTRGVALTAALAGAAALSQELASAAVAAATGASLSSVVVSLADGASAMTLLNKLKLTGVAVLFLLLSAGGVGPWGANNTSAAPVPKEKQEEKAQGLIWFHDRKANELVAYTPDGQESERRKLPADQTFISVTPDGKQILYAAAVKGAALDEYHLRPFDGDAAGTSLNVAYLPSDQFRGWSPDGKRFVRGRYEDIGKIPGVKALGGDYLVINLTTKRSTPVVLPDETLILSWAPDGEQFIGSTVSVGPEVDPKLCTFPIGNQLTLIKPNDGVLAFSLAPSADGQTQLVGGQKPGADKSSWYHAVYRFDPAAKKPFTELLHEEGQGNTWAVPSPGGTHLAAAWMFGKKQGDEDELRLTVAKADGTGRTTVTLRDKGKGDDLKSLALLGWFPSSKIKAPVPKAKAGEEVLLISSRNGSAPFLVVSPDGKSKEVLPVPSGVEPATVRVSPDGRWAAYGEPLTKNVKHAQGYWPNRVRVIDLHSPDAEPRTLMDETYGEALMWSADGKDVFVSRFDPKQIAAITAQKNGLIPMATTRVHLADGKETAVELPEGHRALTVSPDGQTWLTNSIDTNRTTNQAFIVTTKDGVVDQKVQVGKHQLATQLSADGKRALCGTGSVEPGQYQLASVEIDTAQMTEIKLPDVVNKQWIGFARWSADGSRLAFAWTEQVRDRKGNAVEAARVTVCDADGSNPVTVAELEPGATIRGIDWMPAKAAPVKKDDPKAKPPKGEPIKAPVPPLKAMLPPKLDRPPVAPEELRTELAGWDAKYRHGSEEKFAELEKRADKLAKGCESDHDRARVWYTVAHIAAQSNIGKHADRVRKYAEKCLKLSRDPLDRGRMYSYLANCEEAGQGEFADRRRKAADWLLKGYLELLVQELPDAKLELPGVVRFALDGEAAENARARAAQAAQLAALEQAAWVNDQIGRRDTLVLCFRNLYEPIPQAHGHGPDGPAELRKLAAAKLPSADDVDTLMKRVLPKGE